MREEADLMGGWADTDGMDARAVLYAALMRGGPHSPDRSERASALLDAYAHELAEKVLALRGSVPDLKARQLFKDGYDAALMVAALTIDPEKEGE
jgi:hypothetical protein